MYKVDIHCPNCKTKPKVALGNMSSGHGITCHNCSATINFDGDGGRKAEKAIKNFEKEIKKMFR
ncbi:MAG: hypothetical protein MI751_11895 [Pseudomonadales bacterium]|nr:hypothetical protein [Pseudomonadales bacterium]